MNSDEILDNGINLVVVDLVDATSAYIRGEPASLYSAKQKANARIKKLIIQGQIEQMKTMRELLPLFKPTPAEQMQGKTAANEFIKKQLTELNTKLQALEGESK